LILFVDDEKMFVESYVEALNEAGYEVLYESHLDRALTLFKKHLRELQVIILDIMFAGVAEDSKLIQKMDNGMRAGEALLGAIREIRGSRRVPKIILTNVMKEDFEAKYAEQEDIVRCLKKHDVLPSKLVEIVREVIG
jgi:CheY-like chemotaxis protein